MTLKNFNLFNDRNDSNYLQLVSQLLSFESLEKNVITDKDDKNPVVTIKFSGLSAMTLLNEGRIKNKNPVYQAFKELIQNQEKIIDLNNKGIAVNIKILFAYPYSDFYYDLIRAEVNNSRGASVECIINKDNYVPSIEGPEELDYNKVTSSLTYISLIQSLSNLDRNRADIFNKGVPIPGNINTNKLIVKFTPVNGLCCLLQINNTIFLDSYLFAKENWNSNRIALISPIVMVKGTHIGKINKLGDKEKEIMHGKLNQQHYYSILSHFRYFWNHDLTLYSRDVCKPNGYGGRVEIIKPHLISYINKAARLKRLYNFSAAEIDMWKQRIKIEFQKYASKFSQDETRREKEIKLFIVGSWKNGVPNPYMLELSNFINANFLKNEDGLRIKPDVVNVDVGDNMQEKVFRSLREAQIGCIIQTADIDLSGKDLMSRPNIYLEKGYMIKQFGVQKNHKNIEKVRAFTFKEDSASMETDNINTGYASFSGPEDFKDLYFKIIYWIWEMTELNSTNALSLLSVQKLHLEGKKAGLKLTAIQDLKTTQSLLKLDSFLSRLNEYVREIESYLEDKGNDVA